LAEAQAGVSAPLDPTSNIHVIPHPAIATTGSQIIALLNGLTFTAMAMPSTDSEPNRTCCAAAVKKPRGHYTARLPTRLPLVRFRRCSINR
jgi:hypothetical protein